MKKDVVAGLGEIGGPIFQLVSKVNPTLGYDINPNLTDKKNIKRYESWPTSFLHICIPFTPKFINHVVSLFKKFNPEAIVIHSTISPNTTKKLQEVLSVPVIYSATRGVHKRMIYDLKRYVKFYAIEPNAPRKNWAILRYSRLMKRSGIKTKRMSNPLTLELAKIVCDTSYYGWLINYAQLSNMLALKNKVDYDEMWTFADEIHKYLGNRPKLYPGYIGGHCVIPNLDLIKDSTLNLIKEINSDYSKILKKRS
ncbi:MAG: hypothetical protein E6L00_07995 [Thaumarchaeota archaeon]|nr:MAG: hypothetical protein E6L00_07995 [Nitrososphaerota archaeon]